ncbi:hypothetical protein KW882_01525 [Vibrio parahaemolyticus]
MARSKTPTHIVEFPLLATPADVKAVEVRFSFLRQLYNAALSEIFKCHKKLVADQDYQETLVRYRAARKDENDKLRKEIGKELSVFNEKYGVTEAAIQRFTTANKNACCFSDHLDAHTTQTIASRAFKAYSDWKFKGRGKPRFKSWRRAIRSANGKAKSCVRILIGDDKKPTRLNWNKLEIPVKLAKKDNQGYEAAALELIGKGQWKFCRVLTRKVRGETKLYLQVALAGKSFVKEKHRQKLEKVKNKITGMDIGPSTIAAVSLQDSLLSPLAAEMKEFKREIAKLQSINANRLRLNNPDNYTSHQKQVGRKTKTVFKVKKGARDWVKSQSYRETQAQITELYRLMAVKRKQGHDILANEILFLGTTVITEKLSYKAWQKIFGRSVGAFAPSSLINTIKRKAENADGRFVEINTWKAKLSQYDHVLDSYQKKTLSERVHLVGGKQPVQRDLYSAFLAMCINEKENIVSRTDALKHWSSVRHSLDAAVMLLSETASRTHLRSSFGLGQLLPSLQSERLAA